MRLVELCSGVESRGVVSGVVWDHHRSRSSRALVCSPFTGLSLRGVRLSRLTGEKGTLNPSLSGLNKKLCLLEGEVIL